MSDDDDCVYVLTDDTPADAPQDTERNSGASTIKKDIIDAIVAICDEDDDDDSCIIV